MTELTKKQKEKIADNLRAFETNFGKVTIRKADYGSGFYVYYPAEFYPEGNYIQYCYSLDYLDGWLYGVVQGAIRGEFKPFIQNRRNNMLKVTITSGNAPERSIYVNDLLDIKIVQDAVLDEFQKVMAQEDEDNNIILQRILEKVDCETVGDLDDWVENAVELKDALDSSDYDSIDEMTEAIDGMKDALYEISRSAEDWV